MTTLRCGRIDAHPPHDWSRPPGWSRPRRTYHCEGTPAAVEGGHFRRRGVGVSPYDWPPSPHLDAWAMRVRLLAACARGEAKQGWVPCRVVRRIVGGQR